MFANCFDITIKKNRELLSIKPNSFLFKFYLQLCTAICCLIYNYLILQVKLRIYNKFTTLFLYHDFISNT